MKKEGSRREGAPSAKVARSRGKSSVQGNRSGAPHEVVATKSSRGKASGQPTSKRSPGKTSSTPRATSRPARTPKKSVNANPEGAARIYERLARRFPDAHCALDHRNAYELLVATILSAQCTDKRVNMVTPALFARWPDAEALSAAKPEELEEAIRSTGFFRSKTKSLLGMANAVVERHHGRVPDDMDALVHLPGVGRKTANVVLGNAFDRNEGVVVDTHVTRVSQRLGLTKNSDPVKIERDLMALFPRARWTMLSHLFIEHGRQICDARKPRCESCPLSDLCPSSRV